MNEPTSKRIAQGLRSPAVTLAATPTGLSIKIAMPREDAKAIAATAAQKPRAKATASKLVLEAVRHLTHEETRDRSAFLQADIPSKLKTELVELSKAKNTTITRLIFDKLVRWINPKNGKRRIITKNGTSAQVGPTSFREYVVKTKDLYLQASAERSMVRLQVDVGPKISRYLRGILSPNRISMGRFLTALVHDIIEKDRAANLPKSDAMDPNSALSASK